MSQTYMNKFFQRVKQLLLYGGLEKKQYEMISSEIDSANRKSIIILSSACLIVYALRLCLTYSAVPELNRVVFLNAILLFGILAVSNVVVQDNQRFVHISAYLFMAFYLVIGIISAIGPASIHERTTLYLVFVVVAPMLYALNAVELTAIIAPAEIIYLILIAKFQSSYSVYITNQGNSLFFSITGLLLGIYMANIKISGIYNTYMSARAEEIKKLNKELAFSRQQLQSALSSAEHASQAKTVFLNNMSHDIRTPMNAVIGFTSLAQSHIDDKEQVRDYLSKIMTSSQHLLSLINDVLDMSQIENGSVTIDESPLSISKLLQDIRTITQNGIDSKGLNFYIDTQDITDDTIMRDNLKLQQVLLNILGNSIKFTPSGGTITVNSTEGEGSEFIVCLRFAVNQESLSPEKDDSLKTEPLSVKKILLVEDNVLNEEIARTILTDHDFIVDSAFNGSEAVSKVKNNIQNDYDLILMDIRMPVMDGYEAARTIRSLKDPKQADIPIIAMTANAFEEDRRAAFEAGMNGHISKPVDIENLLRVIHDL
ncbi:MAG: response regulator [Anaerostipes sp.]|nr:response regulator [uncultured Anaerostipes sp.]